jgi:hypothetical protein|tara:strand:+ start:1203 stop:1517 length:315 start_codon:yes stop_codon:yes gene_type:complete
MFKILILAYVIGQSPIDTQQTFRMGKTFDSMEECKAELLLKTRGNGTYDVMWDFVNKGEFQWDWLMAGCKNDETGEEFSIEPTYPKGKPDELIGLTFKKNYQDI